MPPEDGRNRAPQILGRGLALGAARLNQRLQAHPCSVRQHRSSSHQEEQNARHHSRFKREQALVPTGAAVWWIKNMQNFAERNPAQAMLEGAEFMEFKRFEAQAKGVPSLGRGQIVEGRLEGPAT